MQIGAKGGLNFSTIDEVMSDPSQFGMHEDWYDYRLGYHLGVYSRIEISKKFFFQPEFLFSDKGYRVIGTSACPECGGAKLHFGYINLPLLAGFKPIEKLEILLGPEVGYLVTAWSRVDSRNIDASPVYNNKFDAGLAVGLQYAIDEKLHAGIRYVYGLSSVMEICCGMNEKGEPTNETLKLQNRAIQLSVGYRLF